MKQSDQIKRGDVGQILDGFYVVSAVTDWSIQFIWIDPSPKVGVDEPYKRCGLPKDKFCEWMTPCTQAQYVEMSLRAFEAQT